MKILVVNGTNQLMAVTAKVTLRDLSTGHFLAQKISFEVISPQPWRRLSHEYA